MNAALKRWATAAVAVVMLLGVAACTIDGQPVRQGRTAGTDTGHVDTDKFENLLAECEVLPARSIAKAVGGSLTRQNFYGAICRWLVSPQNINVTFNWFEWGNVNLEKETAKRLGFTTENISVQSQAAFTQRDPARPSVCGVTAKSPRGGVYTWWVEPEGAASDPDPCKAPIKLMEMILTGAY